MFHQLNTKIKYAAYIAIIFALILTAIGLASDVAVAVVDVIVPTNSVTLQAGQSAPIVINLTVSGQQDGTATFTVYRNWTLSGGVFSGDNSQTFTVPAGNYTGGTTWTSSTTGTVKVAAGQSAGGPFTLAVSAFGITNSNQTGGKLADGADSNYKVTVTTPPSDTTPPDTSITANPAILMNSTSASFSFTGSDDVTPAGSLNFECSLDGGSFVACTNPKSYSGLSDGSHTFQVRAKDAANNVDPSPASYNWTVDTVAPTIIFVGPATSAWYNADVTTNWSCSDASGVVTASVSATTSGEGVTQSATGTCTDNAGNSASNTQYFKVDKTAPTASANANPDPNTDGWNNTDVTVSFNGIDGLSGISSCSSNVILSSEGADQSASGTCTDKAGNESAKATASGINIDKTKPTITDLGPTASANGSNGWYKTAVTNKFQASDKLSGFASPTTNPYDFTVSSGTSEGNVVKVNSGSVTDLAGNTAAAIDSAAFKIDLSDPTNIAFVGGLADGGSYYFGSVPAAPTCTAEDAVSGLASCEVAGYIATVGPHILTATATDNAGRTTTATRSYTVLAWNLSGFYQPVDMTPVGATTVWNTVKNGSTVPLKFEVFAGPVGSNEQTDTSVVSAFYKQVTCNAGTEDTVEVTATGGTSLRYDLSAGQFVYNWQTPKLAGKCYSVTMTTQDGSSLTAFFKLK